MDNSYAFWIFLIFIEPEPLLGEDKIKMVEAQFCELCQRFLPRLDDIQKARAVHCRAVFHQKNYNLHQKAVHKKNMLEKREAARKERRAEEELAAQKEVSSQPPSPSAWK